MAQELSSPVNDRATVLREYASEERFLARRLAAWAELDGPLVEDAAIEAVAECESSGVLEVGCGTGDFTERVRRELRVEVVALDLSRRMTKLTRARALDVMQGDIQALPFAANVFDCVLANRVLYHVPDLAAGLAEIARVLRPSGRLVAVTYSDDHLAELNDVLGHPLRPSPFSAENGEALLRNAFEFVRRRDFSGSARFSTADSIREFLRAYGEFSDVDLAARAGDLLAPFTATYRHCIFVASKGG